MSETAARSDQKAAVLSTIYGQGLLPLYFHQDETVSIAVLKALYEAGIRTVEYTNRGEAALKNFKSLKKNCEAEMSDMQLGIGTIKTGDDAKAFVDAGADYLISPGVVKAAAKVAQKNGLLYIPGCLTPTEMIRAEALGATLVKIFPGNLLGPGYISSIRDIFPDLKFVVTGGVEPEAENIRSWFTAGVSAVGMGSKLISKTLLAEGNYAALTNQTKTVLDTTKTIMHESRQ